jgi:hypothetical protein
MKGSSKKDLIFILCVQYYAYLHLWLEEVFMLKFKRSSKQAMERLHNGELLRPCREALEEAQCEWLLEHGVKVFVHPTQYHRAVDLLRQHCLQSRGGLFSRFMVVSNSMLLVVKQALEGCSAGAAKQKSLERLGKVPGPCLKSTTQLAEKSAPALAESLFLLQFQRASSDFQQRLSSDTRLEFCRQALEDADCRWFLQDEKALHGLFGVKVFVRPPQYQQALQLLQQQRTGTLYLRHVLVSESLLPLVLEVLRGCKGGGGTLKGKEGQVKIGELQVLSN